MCFIILLKQKRNDLGSGKKHGAAQRFYNADMTITPSLHDITVYQDWYQIAAGRADLGDFMFRVSQGFAADISKRVYSILDATYASLPSGVKYSGAYSDSMFTQIVQKLEAANGMKIYCLGTLLALQQVLPSNDFLKIPFAEQWGVLGYVGQYKRVDFIEVPQMIVPGTINSTMELGLDDDRLYLMAADDKPVKVVYEGETMVYENNVENTSDNEIIISTQMRYGVGLATSAFHGIYDLGE